MAFQVNDILSLVASAAQGVGRVFVDGGPSRNRFLMQLVADYIGRPVVPSRNSEVSAMGAAYLAGLAVGFWPDTDVISGLVDHGAEISPSISREKREDGIAAWARAIARTTLEV